MLSPGWADLHDWRVDRGGGVPVVRQIYGQVRSAVLKSILGCGAFLLLVVKTSSPKIRRRLSIAVPALVLVIAVAYFSPIVRLIEALAG